MKNRIIKLIAFALAAFCLLSQLAAFAVSPDIIRVESNTEFAVQTAKIIGEYESQTNISAGNCRVIGRALTSDFDFGAYGAEKGVVGKDGRFFLQFENEKTAKKCLDSLNSDPDIAYAEPDGVISVSSDEAESSGGNLSWGVEAIGADKYSEHLSEPEIGRSVTVAVIDSGVANIDYLNGRIVDGYDFVDNDTDPSNDTSSDSHGTFIASIIADCTKDAPVKIMPVRILSSQNALISNAANGIYYAVDNGAQVLNLSFGGSLSSQNCKTLDEAIAYADSKNVSVVVSAGNEGIDTKKYCPAHNISAITVTSVYEDLSFANGYSNFGKEVDLCAPGMNIVGYSSSGVIKKMGGTSMAAGFISASAALFRLDHPECNALQTQEALKNSCSDLGSEGFDIYYGYGIPQLDRFISDETVYAEGIDIPEKKLTLVAGETKTLTAEVLPAGASNKAVKWTSSNPDAVTVSESGVLTAVNEGSAIITAESVDGGYTAQAEITVLGHPAPPSVVSLSVISPPDKTVYVYKSGGGIELDGLELEAVYSDGNKKAVTPEQGITVSEFSTSSVGEKAVTVEYGGCSASFNITVEYAWWQWIIRILLLGFLWY
ncbi:MAG: S8 family serine peptidase [Acutalibacteraceae bacterium]